MAHDNSENIVITEMDLFRLDSLIENGDPKSEKELNDLSEEISKAKILDFPEVPSDVVTMNSTVRYLEVETEKESEATLVYPQFADAEKGKISVLAPIGTALLGLREGQEIQWKLPSGRTKILKVLDILYQPENNGDFHL